MKSFATLAFAGLATFALSVSTASIATAEPACTASNLAHTSSGVLSGAGGYLDAHPGANDVLTAAATQSTADAQNSIRNYFFMHPAELFELQGIARPLIDLRQQCGIAVSPGQLATLVDAFS